MRVAPAHTHVELLEAAAGEQTGSQSRPLLHFLEAAAAEQLGSRSRQLNRTRALS